MRGDPLLLKLLLDVGGQELGPTVDGKIDLRTFRTLGFCGIF